MCFVGEEVEKAYKQEYSTRWDEWKQNKEHDSR